MKCSRDKLEELMAVTGAPHWKICSLKTKATQRRLGSITPSEKQARRAIHLLGQSQPGDRSLGQRSVVGDLLKKKAEGHRREMIQEKDLAISLSSRINTSYQCVTAVGNPSDPSLWSRLIPAYVGSYKLRCSRHDRANLLRKDELKKKMQRRATQKICHIGTYHFSWHGDDYYP